MNVGIATRFGAVLVGVALAVALAVGLVANHYAESLVGRAEVAELTNRFDQLEDAIDAAGIQSESLAVITAAIPEVAAALGRQDRDRLLQLATPLMTQVRKTYAVEQFHFHLPPATSFLRMHKPEKFGDDMSADRLAVVRTNTERKPTHGLETGMGGLGIRGIVPVFDGDRHVGSLEFGLSFGQPFFEAFKKAAQVDVVLHLKAGSDWKVFAATVASPNLSAGELARAIGGERVIREIDADGRRLAILGHVVKDFGGRPIGVAEVILDASPYGAQLSELHRTTLLLMLAAMVFCLAVGIPVARRITKPIRHITRLMDRISNRDFAFEVDGTARHDEIGHLARGVQTVRESAEHQMKMEAEQAALLEDVHRSRQELEASMQYQLEGVVEAAIQSNEAGIVVSHMLASVRRTAQESQSIAAAIEELVASVNTIAQNSEVAAQEAGDAESAAREGVGAANTARGASDTLMSAVGDVGGKIQALAEATGQIGDIVAQIEAIAAQTNLLALNATIEAARAGEAGKGFAVVAGEVKNLANQTARATEDIRSRIESLRQEMDAALAAMGQSSAAAEQGKGAVGQVTDRLDAIAGKIDGVTARMRDIAGILNQQTQVSAEVSSGTARIATLSQGNSEEIATVLDAFSQTAKVLDGRVEDFAKKMSGNAIIEIAKNDHTRFKRGIIERLSGRSDLTADKLADHHTCRLGKWYDNVTEARIKDHPSFGRLMDPHQRVHAHGKKALELHAQGKVDLAFEEAELMNAASREVLGLLGELGRALKA